MCVNSVQPLAAMLRIKPSWMGFDLAAPVNSTAGAPGIKWSLMGPTMAVIKVANFDRFVCRSDGAYMKGWKAPPPVLAESAVALDARAVVFRTRLAHWGTLGDWQAPTVRVSGLVCYRRMTRWDRG